MFRLLVNVRIANHVGGIDDRRDEEGQPRDPLHGEEEEGEESELVASRGAFQATQLIREPIVRSSVKHNRGVSLTVNVPTRNAIGFGFDSRST